MDGKCPPIPDRQSNQDCFHDRCQFRHVEKGNILQNAIVTIVSYSMEIVIFQMKRVDENGADDGKINSSHWNIRIRKSDPVGHPAIRYPSSNK